MQLIGNQREKRSSVRIEFPIVLLLFGIASPLRPARAQASGTSIRIQDDSPVWLRFYGSKTAELFSREVDASFRGVLQENFYSQARDGFPAGFISASAPGMPWAGTMWTRDAGTGEFGCGMRIPGECYNVVQNNLIALALQAVARMADRIGQPAAAQEDRLLAQKIRAAMDKYLVARDGAWTWVADTSTMRPDPAVLNSPVNLGTGSLNGVAAMYAGVRGFLPLDSSWKGIQHSEQTFTDLYQTPLRKKEFDRYGIWSQTDRLAKGLGTSPSYGQGYPSGQSHSFRGLDCMLKLRHARCENGC